MMCFALRLALQSATVPFALQRAKLKIVKSQCHQTCQHALQRSYKPALSQKLVGGHIVMLVSQYPPMLSNANVAGLQVQAIICLSQTLAPVAPSASAVAFPMPLEPPVTKHTGTSKPAGVKEMSVASGQCDSRKRYDFWDELNILRPSCKKLISFRDNCNCSTP